MHDWWIAVIIGIVEGLTEFLPVSSTGHMILTSHLLNVSDSDETMKIFEVVIQLGAILAVVILYWKRLWRLFGIRDRSVPLPEGGGMNLLHIFIAIAPALLFGFLLHGFIKEVLFSPQTVLIGLVVGGIFLIIGEKQQPQISAPTIEQISYKQALFIGISQCLSLWPGFSRSGATIAGGMLSGVSRAASADFTFIIAIPVMVAASGYDLLKGIDYLHRSDIPFFAIGFIVSFIVALLAVFTFIKLVQKLNLSYFAYYRFIIAALYLAYLWVVGFA
ncbi:MAG: undecaprenyl-diphosphate phosphatase [Paenibacillaceae bacterium]|jgi:undecaprenyl-diphosphatase|nr:undecaprenyl-diphosphate phosphatase [Paenibacillaceae bacterium]